MNKLYKMNALFKVLLPGLIYVFLTCKVVAQDKGIYAMAGTQFPLQYAAGIEYKFHPRLSASVQGGLITQPYDKYLLYCMEVAGLSKNLSRIIERSFERGFTATIGVNYHIDKYYIGLYVLGAQMQGEGPLLELADVYYKGKFPSNIDPALLDIAENLRMNWESDLICAGILAGRKFTLPRRFEFRTEIGFTKIMGSQSRYTVKLPIIDDSSLAQDLYGRMNTEFKESYWKYGYVPSINLYLAYRLK